MFELVLVFLSAIVMTLVIEFPFYWFGKYRDKLFVLGFIFINIATNLSVNIAIYWFIYRTNMFVMPFLLYLNAIGSEGIILFACVEILAFLVEYMVLSQLAPKGKKLFFTVFFANLTSFFLGTALLWAIF